MKERNSKILKIIIIILLISIVAYLYNQYNGGSLIKDSGRLITYIQGLGVLGPVFYILLYIVTALACLSALSLTLIGGILFGPIYGILYTLIGATLGLMASFLISRYLAKDYINKKFGNSETFKKIERGVKEDGWFILAVTRLLPIFPFGVQNYIYGLTSIGFIKYTLLSALFILPGTSVYVLLAGAVASGEIGRASKLSLAASLIFLLLTIIGKVISKKYKK